MGLKKAFVTVRDNYVINQVKKQKLPVFDEDQTKRYKIIFSGRVQHVGFRLEVCELAKRLALTGYCQNMENGDVLAEVQGPENKIRHLVSFMESLKRIKIKDKVMEELAVKAQETVFEKRA